MTLENLDESRINIKTRTGRPRLTPSTAWLVNRLLERQKLATRARKLVNEHNTGQNSKKDQAKRTVANKLDNNGQ